MKEIGIEKLKQIQLEILDVVTKFCDERGINYWLHAGTLLGAVRHKGYIPWDDDIDLGMLRPDYDRFMKEFNGFSPRYEFHCIENDPEFDFEFGKVLDNETVLHEPFGSLMDLAVNVDIFPIDNAPDDEKTVQDIYKENHSYHVAANILRKGVLGPVPGNIVRKICVRGYRLLWMVAHFFPPRSARFFYLRKIAENAKRYANENTERVGDFCGGTRITCKREILSNLIELEFEGKMYKAPVGYDEWLTLLYGDYMTPPPPEKRTSGHSLKAYWKDKDASAN